tara:strand:+ start:16 stop:255 length:240 start_codon:yes stop_codon:yes gene_type:complete
MLISALNVAALNGRVSLTARVSAFADRIPAVVERRSKKQVRGVDASPIVAAMTNHHSFYIVAMQLHCDTMGKPPAAMLA